MACASAPGKLFISGEYAVLDGGVAIVTAVGVRARAHIARLDETHSTFVHPLSGESFPFTATRADGLRWVGADPGHWGEILVAVVANWFTTYPREDALPALSVQIDTDEFFRNSGQSRRKLGFGSSAASVVALSQGLAAALGQSPGVADLERFCTAAHAHVQQGLGSGFDVRTAVRGGVISGEANTASCRELPWPPGLLMVPVWTGVEARSVELVGRFRAYAAGHRDDYAEHLGALRRAASAVQAAWETQHVDQILRTLNAYDAELIELDRAASIGIYPEVHDRLRKLAEAAGASYKISGAGGGDVGLAFATSERVAREFSAACAGAGFEVLDVAIEAPGARVEPD